MTKKGKDSSMKGLCEVFQDRKDQIFGERAPLILPTQEKPVNVNGDALSERANKSRRSRVRVIYHPLSAKPSSWADPSKPVKRTDLHSNLIAWSANQGQLRKSPQVRKMIKQYPVLPQISTKSTDQELPKKKWQDLRKITEMAVVSEHEAEQKSTGVTWFSSTQHQISTQSTNEDQQVKTQQVQRRITKMNVARQHQTTNQQVQRKGTKIALDHQHQTTTQDRKTAKSQQVRRVTKLYIEQPHDAEQRTANTAIQHHVPHFRAQEQRRVTQKVMIRKLTKPPLPRTLDVEVRSGESEETMIHKHRRRRPRIGQRLRAVPEAVQHQANMVMSREKAASNETAIARQYRNSPEAIKQVELLTNKDEHKGNKNASKHLENAHNDQTKRRSRIVIMNVNQGTQGRRVAIQHGNNDNECSARRNALCKQTDPTQQELTFIRVLRKRF